MSSIIIDPKYDNIYDLFISYFNDPLLLKVSNINNYGVYAARIKCLLNVNRYIIVSLPNDYIQVGSTRKLSSMKWDLMYLYSYSFAYDVYSKYNPPVHTYTPNNIDPYNTKIKMMDTNNSNIFVTYACTNTDFPLQIMLLTDDGKIKYNKIGTICSAIETYKTVIKII